MKTLTDTSVDSIYYNFENSPFLQIIIGHENRIMDISKSMSEFLGAQDQELLTQNFLTLFPLGERNRIEEGITLSQFSLYTFIRASENQIKQIHLESFRLSAQDKTLIIIRPIASNTELVDVLEEIQRTAKIGYWSFNLIDETVNWSSEVYKIHELPISTKQITREFVFDAFIPEHRVVLSSLVEKCVQHGDPYDVELSIVTIKGNQKWLRCIGHPKRTNGRITELFGVVQDVTDIRKKTTEIEEAEERLQFALMANKFGIWDWNVTDDVLYWDENMLSLFEVEREKFTNKFSGIETLFFPEDKERVIREVDKCFKENSEFDTWFRIMTPKGNLKYIGAKGKVNHRKKGKLWMTGVNWDISKEKKQEQLIIDQQANMISSARLSSLGEMAGGIAHEINNPLQIILGHANLLKRKIDRNNFELEDLRLGLTLIEKTSDRIVKIIRGLMNFSRNAEKDPKELVSVEMILNDVISLVAEKFSNKGIHLITKFEYDGKVMANNVQLGQVFMNILNNAYDAVKDVEEKWISIRTRKENDTMLITFIDSGKGMTKETEEKIFEPFYTTKDVGSGTGLGLPISKGILEDHRGHITFGKEENHTCFTVSLPLESDNN